MTASNWIAVILPVLGFVFASILYTLQKRIDRLNEEKRERRELYRRAAVILQRVHNILERDNNRDSQVLLISEFEEVVAEIQVSAPDSVAEVWSNIPHLALDIWNEHHSDDQEIDVERYGEFVNRFISAKSESLIAMRRDTFGDTIITADRIREIMYAFVEINTASSNLSGILSDMIISKFRK